MDITPLHDRVVIRPQAADTKTAGGIIIPETAKEKPQKGVVIAAGKGAYHNGILQPMEVAPGDVVLYGKYAGSEIDIDQETVLVMRESDILAII